MITILTAEKSAIEKLRNMKDFSPPFFGKNVDENQKFILRFNVTDPYKASSFFHDLMYETDHKNDLGITNVEIGPAQLIDTKFNEFNEELNKLLDKYGLIRYRAYNDR